MLAASASNGGDGAGAAALSERLDRLPFRGRVVGVVLLLALGGFLEVYELFQMTYLPAGLIRDGVFVPQHRSLWGVTDQGLLGVATFLGLFLGEMVLAPLSDRRGRRSLFLGSMVLYIGASVLMAFQQGAMGIQLCRLVAGCGIGAQIVVLSAYLGEVVPKHARGRAFMIVYTISYLAMPMLALLSWLVIPISPLGLSGWRLIVLLGAALAVVVAFLQKRLPESPRWLLANGDRQRAEAVLDWMENRGSRVAERRSAFREDIPASVAPPSRPALWGPATRGRMLLLVVFNIAVSFGFFGMSQWLPTLLASAGVSTTKSLFYSFLIAFAYPAAPAFAALFVDRVERKWLIVALAALAVPFGAGLALARSDASVILFGVAVTLCISSFAAVAQGYQNEIVPTAIRTRAFGFAHGIGRLSGAFSSIVVGALLAGFGPVAVFAFICSSWCVIAAVVTLFGPRSTNRSLESIEISSKATV